MWKRLRTEQASRGGIERKESQRSKLALTGGPFRFVRKSSTGHDNC